jgi:hypothetical protein
LAASLTVALVGCSNASPAPKGWAPMPGASAAWSSGSGSSSQEYFYAKHRFGGTLQDLASQVTVDALTRNPGAKYGGNVPFAPCPGAAGLATLRRRDRTTLQVGFAVHDGYAVRVTYVRPVGTPPDPNVTQAMQNVLCSL